MDAMKSMNFMASILFNSLKSRKLRTSKNINHEQNHFKKAVFRKGFSV